LALFFLLIAAVDLRDSSNQSSGAIIAASKN